MIKKAAAAILALSLCLSLAACGNDSSSSDGESASSAVQETSDPTFVQKTVEEMAIDYGTYGSEAKERIDTLLSQLSEADKSSGERWKTIMDLWMSDKLGTPLNYDVLPDGLPDTDELCIVVLGFQLEPDGSMKDELIQRLTVALNSAKKYPKAYIVCTGGGTASENPSASEAGEMAKWLEAQGIDKGRIIVEDNSITTAQNAIFTYDILTSLYPSVKKLAIVSSDYHIATGELLFMAEPILRANAVGNEKLEVISNAAWKAPSGTDGCRTRISRPVISGWSGERSFCPRPRLPRRASGRRSSRRPPNGSWRPASGCCTRRRGRRCPPSARRPSYSAPRAAATRWSTTISCSTPPGRSRKRTAGGIWSSRRRTRRTRRSCSSAATRTRIRRSTPPSAWRSTGRT